MAARTRLHLTLYVLPFLFIKFLRSCNAKTEYFHNIKLLETLRKRVRQLTVKLFMTILQFTFPKHS